MENVIEGKFHDQGDARWTAIRGHSRGHDDMPFGRANSRPAYRPPGGWPPLGRIWWFKLPLINDIFFQHCPPDHEIHQESCLR
jgi:hypothetical protein